MPSGSTHLRVFIAVAPELGRGMDPVQLVAPVLLISPMKLLHPSMRHTSSLTPSHVAGTKNKPLLPKEWPNLSQK